jgi:FMN phosphatase YigB (HAD superfamily)
MPELVFLIDVDNTLLNNDAVKQDFDKHLRSQLGPDLAERFWDVYEQVRQDKNFVDIPETLVRFREQISHRELPESDYLRILSVFDRYPFHTALYPQALETLQHLGGLGSTVIVSDGDQYYQAKKIIAGHLAAAVEGRVLLYIHKQEHLDEVLQYYPGEHYTMIDDKPQILIDIKSRLGERVTTVFVKQGKYAENPPDDFAPDFAVSQLADLLHYSQEQFLTTSKKNT